MSDTRRAWTLSEIRYAQRWKRMGMTAKEIGVALDRTEKAVFNKLDMTPEPVPADRGEPVYYRRPSWTLPDPALLAVCHEARDEIQRELRRRRRG